MDIQASQLRIAVRRFRSAHKRAALKLALVRAGWTALVALLTALLADFAFAFGDGLRFAVDAALLIVPVAVAVVSYRRLTRSAAPDRMVARLLEAGRPELGNDLVNALDFERRVETAAEAGLSPDLMRHGIARAAEEAFEMYDLAPLRPPALRTERYALLGAVAGLLVLGAAFPHVAAALLPRYYDPFGDHPPYCATRFAFAEDELRVHYGEDARIAVKTSGKRPRQVVLVVADPSGRELGALPMFESARNEYVQTVQNVTRNLRYFARVPGGRSKRQTLAVILTPRIETATAEYRYPAYTRRDVETRDLPDPPVLRGYDGTEVTLTLASNRPLRGGTVTVCGTSYPLSPAGENSVAASFPLRSAGAFSAGVVDVEGIESRQRIEGAVELVPDEAPRIEFTSPGMDSFATPDAVVPLAVEAGDDLGVARIALLRSFNGSRDLEKRLFEAEGAPEPFAAATETLDLADLGVRPGDVVDYYATATDTFPGRPHTAASPAFRLKIVSQEEYRAFLRSQTTARDLTDRYAKLLDAVKALADEQERLRKETEDLSRKIDSGEATGADRAALEAARERQQALADAAGQVAEQFRREAGQTPVFDVQEAYKRDLAEMAGRIEQSKAAMDQAGDAMGRNASAEAAQAQARALEALGQGQQQFQEGVMQASRDLEDVQDLMQNAENFKYLYTLQQGLERQARSFRDTAQPSLDDRIRLQELAEAQEKVREGLDQLKKDLREDAERVQDRFPKAAEDARAIADSIESRKIEESMASGASKLAQGLGASGHGDLERARAEMEKMIDFSEAAGGQAGSDLDMRLRIRMASGLGGTLGQMSQGMQSGLGGSRGFAGQGAAGASASSTPFGMFGNDSLGERSSDLAGRVRHRAQSVERPGTLPLEPGRVEQLDVPKQDRPLEAVEGERIMDEYRGLIDRYFRRLADEGR